MQGLKGDASYLIVKEDGSIADFAINAVCTHLGCVVPWNKAENKFMCPCHGSQYDPNGEIHSGLYICMYVCMYVSSIIIVNVS